MQNNTKRVKKVERWETRVEKKKEAVRASRGRERKKERERERGNVLMRKLLAFYSVFLGCVKCCAVLL